MWIDFLISFSVGHLESHSLYFWLLSLPLDRPPPFEEWWDYVMGTLNVGECRGYAAWTDQSGWVSGQAGWVDEAGKKNAPLTWCFGTVELLWGWYRKPVLFGVEEGGVPPWRERMTEQRDTFWLTVSQPVCDALSGVNMEGWTGENGHEKCQEWGEGHFCSGGIPPTANLPTFE